MAASEGVKPAVLCAVYRNTASGGTKYTSPTWAEITSVRDANVGGGWDFGDASVRGTRAKLYHPTQKDVPASITVRCDNLDAAYLALEVAANAGTALDLLIIDGKLTTEGSRGFRAFYHISDTGQDQAIGNVLYKTYDLKPGFGVDDTPAAAYPKMAVVGASSAVTYTSIGA